MIPMALLLSSPTAILPWLYLLPFDFAMETPPHLGPALAFRFTINAYLLSCVRLPPLFKNDQRESCGMHGASKAILGIYGHDFSWSCFVSYTSPARTPPQQARAPNISFLSIMCPYCTYT